MQAGKRLKEIMEKDAKQGSSFSNSWAARTCVAQSQDISGKMFFGGLRAGSSYPPQPLIKVVLRSAAFQIFCLIQNSIRSDEVMSI